MLLTRSGRKGTKIMNRTIFFQITKGNKLIGRMSEHFLYKIDHSPSSELVGFWDIRVDHQGATKGCRQGTAPKVRQLRPLNGYDRLSRTIKLFCLQGSENSQIVTKRLGFYYDFKWGAK